jgi:alanyl-tRNA synthetase
VVLDKTAFFPEEGGQSSDDGFIGNASVNYVYEKDGIIHHITDIIPDGKSVICKLNFSKRFEKMQCHTAEHIFCGIIYKNYGLENVGFHLGEDFVTFDISGYLSGEEIDKVESLANEAVFANLPVLAYFPQKEELPSLSYRSKLDLKENVRLVKIGDIDLCACCAPHLGYTGEIGLIKILDFMKHRGGTRITMTAGRRALSEFKILQSNIKRISALLSEPPHTTADMLEKFITDAENTASELKRVKARLAELYAEALDGCEGNLVIKLDGFSFDDLRSFSNSARGKCDGLLVAISGSDGDYKYVISSKNEILRDTVCEINTALSGKGGGRGTMIQGSFAADFENIKEFFEK